MMDPILQLMPTARAWPRGPFVDERAALVRSFNDKGYVQPGPGDVGAATSGQAAWTDRNPGF